VPRPQRMEAPSPRSGSLCVAGKSAAPAMARGHRDCRVIDPFRAVAAAAPTYSVGCARIPQSIQRPEIRAQYDFFDFRADGARSDSAGLHLGGRANPLSVSPDLPRALLFCLGRLPAADIPTCASLIHLRVHGDQAVDGETRYASTAAAVLEIGAANRIPFLNRVLGVIARIYQATSRVLPPVYDLGARPSGWQPSFGSRSTAQNRFLPSWV